MPIFRLEISKGSFLIKGQDAVPLAETTTYYISADTKDAVIENAKQFVCEKIGHSANRLEEATIDDVAGWLLREDQRSKVAPVAEGIAQLKAFVGSIQIDGVVIVSPENDPDLLIVALSEGGKKRVLIEPLYLMDQKEGGVQWGGSMKPLNAAGLSKAVQSLF